MSLSVLVFIFLVVGVALIGGIAAIAFWFATSSRRGRPAKETPEQYLARTFDGRPHVVTYGDIPLPSQEAVVGEAYARGYQLVQVATVEGQPQPTLYFERIQTQSA
ncbi:hypothetical protein SAMN06298212_10752 [Ruaniaceae bacterium KH17]|nr:hypothetical protein SAMN06298212_10752 [Ruaniaceae bacterium KH17]